jgi:hypothetical protein
MIWAEEESSTLNEVVFSEKDKECYEGKKGHPDLFLIVSDLVRNPSEI